MPQLDLTIDDVGLPLRASSGGVIPLPRYRLHAWVTLGSGGMHWATIDTGAHACVLPRWFWELLDRRGDIVWVTPDPAGHAGSGNAAYHTVLGGSQTFRLGRVQLLFTHEQLAPRVVLAICTNDPSMPAWEADPSKDLPPLLIGLADVMHGRTLLIEASADGQRWSATLNEP